jgi:hypothetical protein
MSRRTVRLAAPFLLGLAAGLIGAAPPRAAARAAELDVANTPSGPL